LTRSSDARSAGYAGSSELENDLRDAAGVQLYPQGIGAAFGVEETGVPELDAGDILAYDATRLWLTAEEITALLAAQSWPGGDTGSLAVPHARG
jgi:hypothetical protein